MELEEIQIQQQEPQWKRGGNTGDNIGSIQVAGYQVHSHAISDTTSAPYTRTGTSWGGANVRSYTAAAQDRGWVPQTDNAGDSETRPININVMYIIKR